jgi:N4-gp56 family major capsid protein
MAGQIWSVNALGGYMYSDQLSNVLRLALLPTVKFRQFCDAKDATEKGLHSGQFFNWNVYSRVANGGAQLDENVEMPTTNFTITQGQLQITEYGNSVPYTGKLDDFSKQPVTEIIHKVLKVDAKETLDGAAWAQFNTTVQHLGPAGGNSTTSVTLQTGAPTITNAASMTNSHVKAISDIMKEANVPPYTGDDYYAMAWPTTFRTFKNSLEAIRQYVETGFQMIANGEIGRYEGIRFIEQTAIAHGGAYNATTYTFRNPVPWTNGLSDWCFFFGEDTVAEAVVIPEEIRGKIPTDYGRSRGIAWYYLGGFGLVHGATVADASNARIFKWDSLN